MPLPTSPNTVYAPTDPFLSADANDIQNQIVGLFGGKHGERPLVVPAAKGQPRGSTSSWHYNTQAGGIGWGAWETPSAGTVVLDVPIELPPGERIKAIDVWIKEPASGGIPIRAQVVEIDPATGTPTQKGPNKDAGTGGTFATLSFTAADADFPLTLATDRIYILIISLFTTTSIGDAFFLGAKITYDKP